MLPTDINRQLEVVQDLALGLPTPSRAALSEVLHDLVQMCLRQTEASP